MPALRDLSVALVDDATIAALNQRFLSHTGPTDVLSFNLAPGLGELIVSAERAVIVAKKLRRPPAAELALYLVHGLLHLAGYDDQTRAQRRAMRAAERRVLKTVGDTAKLQIPNSKFQRSSKHQRPMCAKDKGSLKLELSA